MTQLYKTPLLPLLYRRLAFGRAIWNRRGRIDLAGVTRAHGTTPSCHTLRIASYINVLGRRSRSRSIGLLAVPLCMAFLVLFSGQNAYGQVVTGTLTGTVTDATGATIPNAKVTITQVSTGAQRSATTSTDGLYNFPYLAPDD